MKPRSVDDYTEVILLANVMGNHGQYHNPLGKSLSTNQCNWMPAMFPAKKNTSIFHLGSA